MSFFKKIGNWFVGIFDEAKKAYNEQPQAVKDSFAVGVGFTEVLKETVGKGPAAIRELLATKVPKLDLPKLEELVKTALKFFNIPYTTLDEGLVALQNHIDGMDGVVWAVAEHTLGSLISVLFAPAETKVKTVVSIIEWFYQKFFKKTID